MNTKGEVQFELSKDAAKSNGGGSTNLISRIDLSIKNKNKTSAYTFINYSFYVQDMKYLIASNILSYLTILKMMHF